MEFPPDISKDLILRLNAAEGDEQKFLSTLASEDKSGLISLVTKCLADTAWRSDASHEQFLGKAIRKLSDIAERGALKPEQRSKVIKILLGPEHRAEKLVRTYWTECVSVKTKEGVQKAPIVALASHSEALRLLVAGSGMKEQITGEISFPDLTEDSLYALQKLLEGDKSVLYLQTPENVIGLLDFCNQYGILEPLKQIDDYLLTYMSPADALDTYLTAKLYGRQAVVEKALALFRDTYNPEDAAKLVAWAKDNNATEVREYIETRALDPLCKLISATLRLCEGSDKADELLNRYHADIENAQKTWGSVIQAFTDDLSVATIGEKLEKGPRVFLGLRDKADEIKQLRPELEKLAQLGTLHSLGEVGKLDHEMAEALLRLFQDVGISSEQINLSGAVDVDLLLAYLPSDPSTIIQLDLSHTSGLTQEALEQLVEEHPHISVLKLPSGSHFDDLRCLGKLKQLTDLDISGQPIPGDEVIAIAKGCPGLTRLNMSRSFLQEKIDNPEQVLEALAHSCPRLTTLNIGNCFEQLSTLASTHLGGLPLINLGIAGMQIDDPAALAQAFSGMRFLESLDLSTLKGFDASLLNAVSARCPKLRDLNLSYAEGVSFEALSRLIRSHGSQIESLNVSGCKDINNEKAEALALSLPQLKSFILNDCSLTPEVIQGLIGLRNLDELGLSGMTGQLDDESRDDLCDLIWENPNLSYLTLRGAGELGDSVMSVIGRCEGLKCLNLAYCTLFSRRSSNANNQPKMPTFRDLEQLDVSGSDITFEHLRKVILNAPHLQSLSVNDLDQLKTYDACKMVERDLPNVEVLSMNWIPNDALDAFVAYRGIIRNINMPKLEYLSLRGHDLLEDEHHRLVSRERNANSLDNLRVLDLLGANVDQEFLTKYATHLDRLIF